MRTGSTTNSMLFECFAKDTPKPEVVTEAVVDQMADRHSRDGKTWMVHGDRSYGLGADYGRPEASVVSVLSAHGSYSEAVRAELFEYYRTECMKGHAGANLKA
jgi:hypothetical protein